MATQASTMLRTKKKKRLSFLDRKKFSSKYGLDADVKKLRPTKLEKSTLALLPSLQTFVRSFYNR